MPKKLLIILIFKEAHQSGILNKRLIQGVIGAQIISRKILKITTGYYLTVKLDAALLMYFLFVYGRLFVY